MLMMNISYYLYIKLYLEREYEVNETSRKEIPVIRHPR